MSDDPIVSGRPDDDADRDDRASGRRRTALVVGAPAVIAALIAWGLGLPGWIVLAVVSALVGYIVLEG